MKGFKETLELMKEIHAMKNKDYANSEDPFKNFRVCEALGACSIEAGIVVRMSDKMSRITNLLEKEPDVVEERITDTLVDLANYAIILKCYIDQKNETDDQTKLVK
jgi:hypothetical protein